MKWQLDLFCLIASSLIAGTCGSVFCVLIGPENQKIKNASNGFLVGTMAGTLPLFGVLEGALNSARIFSLIATYSSF